MPLIFFFSLCITLNLNIINTDKIVEKKEPKISLSHQVINMFNRDETLPLKRFLWLLDPASSACHFSTTFIFHLWKVAALIWSENISQVLYCQLLRKYLKFRKGKLLNSYLVCGFTLRHKEYFANIVKLTSRKYLMSTVETNLSWHQWRGIWVPHSSVGHFSHFFLHWTWPRRHWYQTSLCVTLLVKEAFIADSTVIYFLQWILYCSLGFDLGADHGTWWRVQQFTHRNPLCIPPDRAPIPVHDPHSPPFIFN